MPVVTPFIDLTRGSDSLRADVERALADCLDRGIFLRGPETHAFEEEWAAYCGQRHAVGCGSGTDALTVAAAAAGLRRAVVQANTLPLTAIGLHRGGASVTVVDVDDTGWARVDEQAPDDHVPVLLFGRVPPPDSAPAVLYDAAHAHGWTPPPGGSAAWSFYPTKSLGALGDAGAVTTDDAGLAQTLRDLVGRDDRLRDTRQITSRLDELQAAVLRIKLRLLPEWLDERSAIAGRYDRALSDCGITLPGVSLRHLYVVRVPERDALQSALACAGIGAKVHWPVPLSRLDGPWSAPAPTPHADRWASTVLSLPCYPGLTEAEVDRVVRVVLEHMEAAA